MTKNEKNLTAKNQILYNALVKIGRLADHQIPSYAYSENEAGCVMADALNHIVDITISARNIVDNETEAQP